MNRLYRSALALSLGAACSIAAPAAWAQTYPSFTHPTRVTNPFYPASIARLSVALGHDADAALRTEETLLPFTDHITWAGGTTEVIVVQFVAYLDGDLKEVAYDYFGQADTGDVYYFGEDVFNYEDGVVADTHGTWKAGRDGAPPGIIMTAHPFVGQVFHPEDFFPVVFEEDTVISLNEHVMTPAGPITNGLRIRERLLEGTFDLKIYAPGFGEVAGGTEDGTELANLVLQTRVDARHRSVPRSVAWINARAENIFENTSNWGRVLWNNAMLNQQWLSYRSHAAREGVPVAFVTATDGAVARLNNAIASHDALLTKETVNELRAAIIDIVSAYNPRRPVDIARLEVLENELVLDVESGDWTAAMGEHAKAADAVWARLRPFLVTRPGGRALAQELDELFSDQAEAIESEIAIDALDAAVEVMDGIDDVEDRF